MRFGVVGYSTRALVEAVVQFGSSAIAIDAFGDQDTQQLAKQCAVAENWPEDILTITQQLTQQLTQPLAQPHKLRAPEGQVVDAWLLAGGMEHHPHIVQRLHTLAPVLGPTCSQLLTLRDPVFWQAISRGIAGLDWPGAFKHIAKNATGYLYKPVASSGGLHISEAQCAGLDGYWQPYIAGRSLGVTVVIGQRDVRLVGATESLSANLWPGPTPYIYRGSVGPHLLTESQSSAVLAMACRVAAALPGYRGWLQADFIEDIAGTLWLLELNPRWTAGMEILQTCLPLSLSPLAQHLSCYGDLPGGEQASSACASAAGRPARMLKAIFYANRPIELTETPRRRLYHLRDWRSLPGSDWELSLADLPPIKPTAPILFDAGHPILTVRLRKR